VGAPFVIKPTFIPQLPRRARTIGSLVKPSIEAYTVAMPWYEPENFAQLWELASDRDEVPPNYETWHRNALDVMNAWQGAGLADRNDPACAISRLAESAGPCKHGGEPPPLCRKSGDVLSRRRVKM
jgi:hypothetical protein